MIYYNNEKCWIVFSFIKCSPILQYSINLKSNLFKYRVLTIKEWSLRNWVCVLAQIWCHFSFNFQSMLCFVPCYSVTYHHVLMMSIEWNLSFFMWRLTPSYQTPPTSSAWSPATYIGTFYTLFKHTMMVNLFVFCFFNPCAFDLAAHCADTPFSVLFVTYCNVIR